MGLSAAMRPKRKPASYFEEKANGTRNRTTIDKAAEHRMAGTACRRTADHSGAGGLFCAGDNMSFEDMMSRFKSQSEEKMADLDHETNNRRGGGYAPRGRGGRR